MAGGPLQQQRALLTKTFLVALRSPKTLAAQLLTPLVVCLLLVLFQAISDDVLARQTPNPDPVPLAAPGGFPRCVPKAEPDCITIAYAPDDDEHAEIMSAVAAELDLDFDADFRAFPYSPLYPCNYTAALEAKDLYFVSGCANATTQFILDHPNVTQTAVVFYPEASVAAVPGIPDEYADLAPAIYEIMYNNTVTIGIGFNRNEAQGIDVAMSVKLAVDRVLLRRTTGVDVEIEVDASEFPRPPPRFADYDAVSDVGGQWFFIPAMILFFHLLTELVTEKEHRIRVGLQVMGATRFAFWSSWLVLSVVINTLATLVLIASGHALNFDIFVNSNFFALFFTFFLFGLSTSALAMCLSTLITRSQTAQTVGYASVLLGFVFQSILTSSSGFLVSLLFDPGVASWVTVVRWILSFLPAFNFAKAYGDVVAFSGKVFDYDSGRYIPGPGLSWAAVTVEREVNLYNRDPFVVPSLSETLLLLLMNTVVFLVVAAYVDNVFPGESGAAKSPWFFVDPATYGWGSSSSSSSRSRSPASPRSVSINAAAPGAADSGPPAVEIENLVKVYQHDWLKPGPLDCRAVDGLTLSSSGELLCLQGSNGAGKSTTIGVLTGLVPPTSGTVRVGGWDVTTDMEEIRSIIGVCPQHDILFGELSAWEHLSIYSQIKGLSLDEIPGAIAELLDMVDLTDVAHRRVREFSGGMKRRLSVAVACIGNPQLLILDEPTTGMDPGNKVSVWHLIEKLKKDRLILLTTHDMLEADVLGDRIAIMAHGKLRALGRPLELKTDFGKGYKLSAVAFPGQIGTVQSLIADRLPDAALAALDGSSLTYELPFDKTQNLVPCLRALEDLSDKGGVVKDFGLSHSTLEEVFLAVTREADIEQHGSADNDDEDDDDDVDDDDDEPDEQTPLKPRTARETTDSFPMRALLRKNYALQKRQKGSNCCQIMTPAIVIAVLLLLRVIIDSELTDEDTAISAVAPPLPLNFNTLLDRVDGANSTEQCLQFFSLGASTPDVYAAVGELRADGSGTGLLGNIPQGGCVYGDADEQVPYFVGNFSSIDEVNAHLYGILSDFNDVDIEEIQEPPTSYLLEDAYVFVKDYVPGERLVYQVAVNDNRLVYAHRPNNFTRVTGQIDRDDSRNADFLLTTEARLSMLDYMHSAFAMTVEPRWRELVDLVVGNPALPPGSYRGVRPIQTLVRVMPVEDDADTSVLLEIFGTFLFPIALTLQLPVILYVIVLEKEQRLREICKAAGMKMRHYWLSNYLFYIVLYAAVVAVFYVAGVLIELRLFTQTSPLVLILFFAAWGHALIALAFLLSTFISTTRVATVVGYIVALVGSMMSLFLSVALYPYPESKLPAGYLAYVQFGFTRGIYVMTEACSVEFQCVDSLDMDSEVTVAIVAMFVEAVVYLVLALYLDEVLPQQFGVPKHPLFFLRGIVPGLALSRAEKSDTELVEQAALLSAARDEEEEMARRASNQDVLAEHRAVEEAWESGKAGSAAHPVLIRNLRKHFRVGGQGGIVKKAVRGLSLAVRRGEVLGMLGPNGAGKTTTISMLTGLFPPTSGAARIGGFDIRDEIADVHRITGLCPQFSIVWKELSVLDHMLFFSRMRGVPPEREMRDSLAAIRKVGLHRVPQRLAGQLSGGMQRRLALAISLAGNPEVLICDEPSTGLDVSRRRGLWRILQRAAKDRAMILTTHAMEEAEVLSSRILIMVHGRAEAIGPALHLKTTLGAGYELATTYDEADRDRVHTFVHTSFDGAVVTSQFPGTCTFQLKDQVKMSAAFELLQQQGAAVGVKYWSISLISLNRVFQTVVQRCGRADDE